MHAGEAIRVLILELCEKQGITVNKLATLSGLTQSTIDSILKGKSNNPRFETAEKLATGFNMSLDEFFRCIIEKMGADGHI
ncbi:MAG: helix-turn-helix domain-containing protein [Synergistaceae bacterium]|nr:helix-turn-helix domain-containing protein [Synergistaceae bacterium]